MEINPTKLFTLKEDTGVWPEFGRPRLVLKGTIVWQHGTRKSSLGGYIGTYSLTYQHELGYSPYDNKFQLKTDKVEALAVEESL